MESEAFAHQPRPYSFEAIYHLPRLEAVQHHADTRWAPLLRCEPETRAEVDEAKRQAAPKQKLSVGRFVPEITPSLRMSPPGSTWLFMKLYCSHELQNGLIAGPLRALAHDTLNEKMADEWFFIRYADPDPHLRLR